MLKNVQLKIVNQYYYNFKIIWTIRETFVCAEAWKQQTMIIRSSCVRKEIMKILHLPIIRYFYMQKYPYLKTV